jgi:hypothetical protein
MTTRAKNLSVLVGVILAFGTALLLAAATGGAASKPLQLGNGNVAALSRTAGADDALPAAVTAMPAASWISNASASRLVLNASDYRAWVAPGTGGFLCLAVQVTVEGGSGITCAPRKTLQTGPIYFSSINASGGVDVVGLVDDAVDSVRAAGNVARLANNAFVLRNMAGTSLTLGTSAGSHSVDLGSLKADR